MASEYWIALAIVIEAVLLYGAYWYGRHRMWHDHIQEIVDQQLSGGPDIDLDVAKPGSDPVEEEEEDDYVDNVLNLFD